MKEELFEKFPPSFENVINGVLSLKASEEYCGDSILLFKVTAILYIFLHEVVATEYTVTESAVKEDFPLPPSCSSNEWWIVMIRPNCKSC